jgi:RNase P protein component
LTALLASELLSRPEPRDYLVRARSGAYDLDFQELSRTLDGLAKEMTT